MTQRTRPQPTRRSMRFARALLVLGPLAVLLSGDPSVPPASAAGPSKTSDSEPASSLTQRETLVLFAAAGARDAVTSDWRIPLRAWVYVPQRSTARRAAIALLLKRTHGLRVTPEAKPHFESRVNLLLADNKRGRRIVVRLAGETFTLPPTAANGHTTTEIRLSSAKAAAAARDGALTVEAVLPAGDARRFSARVELVPERGVTVISDIDDTVKETHVTDPAQLWQSTFYRPFAAVPGMADLYRRIAPAAAGASLHFVSSSPWHLYEPLAGFLSEAGFPPATMDLKTMRLKDRSILNILKSPRETKPPQIEALITRYPARSFILVGDSGEQDPEIYADILRRHPQRVTRILIRNVTGARSEDDRFSAAFAGIDPGRWSLFADPAEIVKP